MVGVSQIHELRPTIYTVVQKGRLDPVGGVRGRLLKPVDQVVIHLLEVFIYGEILHDILPQVLVHVHHIHDKGVSTNSLWRRLPRLLRGIHP